jgi:uncharacterized membrane protein
MSVLTHLIAMMIGGTVGVLSMAFIVVGSDNDE